MSQVAPKSGGQAATAEIGQNVRASRPTSTGKVCVVDFMDEDYLDEVAAQAALDDPENRDRISWETLKGQLGL
jgi:hypothetical protein